MFTCVLPETGNVCAHACKLTVWEDVRVCRCMTTSVCACINCLYVFCFFLCLFQHLFVCVYYICKSQFSDSCPQMSFQWTTREEVLKLEEWRRSLRYSEMLNNKQQKKLQIKCSLLLVHERRKMQCVLSIYRTTVWLVPSVRADARNGWLMVWKDNVIGFWKRLSPGEWVHICLCNICDTERVSCCKTTDIWDKQDILSSNQHCGR